MKFNKLYESIFKPASTEEVQSRKEQAKLEEFKEWLESCLKIKYEDLFKPENINKQNRWGSTPLIWASYKGYTEIVKLLLDNGADVNIKDDNSRTALMDASYKGYIEIVKLLLDNGANVNIKNKYGYTALLLASRNGYTEIIELLKQYGAKE